ncbi:hypothetical protein RR48_00933, partial [Papilio machaon]
VVRLLVLVGVKVTAHSPTLGTTRHTASPHNRHGILIMNKENSRSAAGLFCYYTLYVVCYCTEGSRSVRARARALACRVVSPLWVEACAASGRRLPEDTFPAPSRPSDLPSPKTLRIMLKKAEMENISLAAMLSDSTEDDDSKKLTLRMSSESDTSNTSTNTSADTHRDESEHSAETTSNINKTITTTKEV